MSKDEILAQALQLSDHDLADLVDDLLARVRTEEIPDWHRKLLDERNAEYEANPGDVHSWEEVKKWVHDRQRKPNAAAD